jgi:hypothetical protein
MSPGGETACGQEERKKNYFRSSASVSRKALPLAVKRAALPERPDAADETCLVELEHVNAVERHSTFIAHAIDGPHHRRLMTDHEDLTRGDLDRLVPGHLSIPELADPDQEAAYARIVVSSTVRSVTSAIPCPP